VEVELIGGDRTIGRTHRRLRRRLDTALATSGRGADDLFHEVRKAAKRVRDAAEQQRGARSHAAFLQLVERHWARRPNWMR
jgi:hypothetical protein